MPESPHTLNGIFFSYSLDNKIYFNSQDKRCVLIRTPWAYKNSYPLQDLINMKKPLTETILPNIPAKPATVEPDLNEGIFA